MTFKLLAEKAITSADYDIFILMKDMSRAFDTVNRKTLMEDLREILESDELHIAKLLLEDVSLMVRCGTSYGETFKTNIGTPQGDCLSPILFTLYLANALKEDNEPKPHDDHSYSTMSRHNTTKKAERESFDNIEAQYADDLSYIAQNYNTILHHKRTLPPKLQKRDLISNPSKD